MPARIDHTMPILWQKLTAHGHRARGHSAAELFAADADRFHRFSLQLDDLFVDYSKNYITPQIRDDLIALARAADLEAHRDQMAAGAHINLSEDRAALHIALRNPPHQPVYVDNIDRVGPWYQTLQRMKDLCHAVRDGRLRGSRGDPIRDVIALGIGGSLLGPAAAVAALQADHDGPAIHFIAHPGSTALDRCLMRLNPATTLMTMASKTFTTPETLLNARSVRDWMIQNEGQDAVTNQSIALTANISEAEKFGIKASLIFDFDASIGGRYSVWSTIGLPLMLAIGAERFDAFRAGARLMDQHFLETPLDANIPVMAGLISVWHRNFLDYPTHAVIPYDDRLAGLIPWLQQLDMESNGKSVDRDGKAIDYATGATIWGYPGSEAQHSFFQHLHQGTNLTPCDFLISARPQDKDDADDAHKLLAANCFAQTAALMHGLDHASALAEPRLAPLAATDRARAAAARVTPGGRPSTTLLYRQLDARMLGMLMALYEHKTFVQAVLWSINPFDQWGVELGKNLARRLEPLLESPQNNMTAPDSSTQGLIRMFHHLREL